MLSFLQTRFSCICDKYLLSFGQFFKMYFRKKSTEIQTSDRAPCICSLFYKSAAFSYCHECTQSKVQGLNFGVALRLLHIILLIPAGSALITSVFKSCQFKHSSDLPKKLKALLISFVPCCFIYLCYWLSFIFLTLLLTVYLPFLVKNKLNSEFEIKVPCTVCKLLHNKFSTSRVMHFYIFVSS